MNTSKGNKLVARSFDLTTSAGVSEAIRAAKDPELLLLIGGPIPYLAKKLFDKGGASQFGKRQTRQIQQFKNKDKQPSKSSRLARTTMHPP